MSERLMRKLIEVALPLDVVNEESRRRKAKAPTGYPTQVHKWWAQRPVAAVRAVLFASLVDDPSSDPARFPSRQAQEDERLRLFSIIERLVEWDNSTNEAVLEEARVEIRRSTNGNPPPLLDPFCGGGTIPLEAQRLGLAVYASDLNPVAVLITKALVEIPPRFAGHPPVNPDARRALGVSGSWKGAAGLADDVRRYGAWMRLEAERRVGHLYPKVRLPSAHGGGEATVAAWLWARTVTCPNPACGAVTPLLSTFVLSSKPGREVHLIPVVRDRRVSFEVASPAPSPLGDPKKGFKRGMSGVFECAVCGTVTTRDYVAAEGIAGRIGVVQTATVAQGTRGRIYLPADPSTVPTDLPHVDTSVLDVDLALNPRDVWCRNFGLTTPRHLFTRRQLVALTTFADLIGDVHERVRKDAAACGLPGDSVPFHAGGTGAHAYADAVATYLSFAISRIADYGNSLASWMPKDGAIRNLFARQAIPMVWDFAEGNPFGKSSAGFREAVANVADCLTALAPAGAGVVVMRDAAKAPLVSSCMVATDPPYYDNIGYADLSDFFYVWLRRSMGSVFPELFATMLTPKSAELVAMPYRHGGSKEKAEDHFELGLTAAFRRLREVSDPSVPLTVYYAFKQAESDAGVDDGGPTTASTGWETMLEALLGAGLSVLGTWPMRTEGATRMTASGTNALASSIVLVCRPLLVDAGITTRKEFVAAMKRELPEALRTLQHGNIAPVDLAQSSIGPGMAIFSRYAKILEPDGSPMRVRTALSLINQVLDELLSEQEGEFDADTRWAIAWYEQFGLGEAAFGTAETLSKAKNSSVAGLVEAGIVAASRGRVRLLTRDEYSHDWDPAKDNRVPVWEATQRLVQLLLIEGEGPAGDLLARLGGLGDTARDLAYRMYHVAERKGWTDEARAYNALVVAWTDLARGAESARAAQPAQTSLGLE